MKNSRGRKKVECLLGIKKKYSFSLYPIEFEKLNIEFQKLKRERYKYYIHNLKEENDA